MLQEQRDKVAVKCLSLLFCKRLGLGVGVPRNLTEVHAAERDLYTSQGVFSLGDKVDTIVQVVCLRDRLVVPVCSGPGRMWKQSPTESDTRKCAAAVLGLPSR